MSKKAIFQPIKIGPVTLKNRIEVAPAAPFLAGHDASVTPEFFKYTCNIFIFGKGKMHKAVKAETVNAEIAAQAAPVVIFFINNAINAFLFEVIAGRDTGYT